MPKPKNKKSVYSLQGVYSQTGNYHNNGFVEIPFTNCGLNESDENKSPSDLENIRNNQIEISMYRKLNQVINSKRDLAYYILYVSGLSHGDISKAMNVTKNSVCRGIYRVRVYLKNWHNRLQSQTE